MTAESLIMNRQVLAPASTSSDTLVSWSSQENEPVTMSSTESHNGIIRWYDPITGRWLSKDPIGISGGLNQYVFCKDNPVNFTDPGGLWTFGFGLSGSVNTIGAGGTAGFQISFSHAPGSGFFGGWNLGLTGFVGGGAVGPIPPGPFGGSLTFDVSHSLNPDIEDTCGKGTEAGGSATFLGVNFGGAVGRDLGGTKAPVYTGHLGVGGPSPSPWSGEGHGYFMNTGVLSLGDFK